MRGRGQYSVEFLVTYGWALLIIGIIVSAIYTFGWFNVNDLIPQNCEFYGQIGCRDFIVTEDAFNLSLVNNFGANLHIGSLEIFLEGDRGNTCAVTYTTPNIRTWRRNTFEIIGVQHGSCDDFPDLRAGSRVTILANVLYYSNTTCSACNNDLEHEDCTPCLHSSIGRINARVQN
ncbi:MAG: hypothetical protein ACMXYK_02830 [Candidatus Woesearchaeota archaeon]